MASVTAFHYQSGNTLIHALDARFKLILTALISITLLHVSAWALVGVSGMLAVLCWHIGLPLLDAVKELRYLFILLFMVFVARVLSTSGETLVQIAFMAVSKQGLVDGGLVCWRLLLIVLLGLVLVSTTRVSEIKQSVAWFFKPVPGMPEKRLATMLGLIVRFIPVILAKAGEVTAAQQARGVGSRKNPLFRLKAFTIPLLRGVFRDAGNLASAMEARCYSEECIREMTSASPRDWGLLIAGSGFCMVAFLI
jgi:energy-coupling factor transporter transmembrane protein EcfT